ncbi:MAG TPA: hypothetical protein VEV17_18665 [Bryobacteraceae bacterium]|nr:hypothetical protein [Bryobacteraceae bacterium]
MIRKPKSTYWSPQLSSNQYAVFHFDVKTMSMRDAEGNYLSSGHDAPLIFDTLEEARRYSRKKITATPALGCRIYDHQGQPVESFSNTQVYDRHHGRPAARRNIAIGAVCLITGIVAVALDAWREWSLTFGVILGVRFLWVGTVKMIDGVTTWKAER